MCILVTFCSSSGLRCTPRHRTKAKEGLHLQRPPKTALRPSGRTQKSSGLGSVSYFSSCPISRPRTLSFMWDLSLRSAFSTCRGKFEVEMLRRERKKTFSTFGNGDGLRKPGRRYLSRMPRPVMLRVGGSPWLSVPCNFSRFR